MSDLIVLGAGPAGLGAAFRAAQRGLSVTVLEKAERVGGASASLEVAGMRVDLGSHRLHPSIEPRILSDLQMLLGDDLQKRTRNGRIRLMDRWLRFPLSPGDLLRNAPRSFVARVARDSVLAPFRRPRADTFAEVLRAGLGPAICDAFYFPYAEKIWGLPGHRLAGEQARRRVAADSVWKIARRIVSGSGSGGSAGSSYFYYPKRGYGQISEALAYGAEARRAEIHLGAEVTSVELGPDRVKVTCSDGSIYESGRVFSTIPVALLARLAGAPSELLPAAGSLHSRSMLLVYLEFPLERFRDTDAHYFPEAWTPVTRISEPKNYRAGSDPDDRTVLCAEIPCDLNDERWDSPDVELAEVVMDCLTGAGLTFPLPSSVHVERLPFAYPVYTVGFDKHLDALHRWVDRQSRLISFGRQGLFAHDNAHHALAMAYAAVDRLSHGGSFDDEGWSRDKERFAAHIVED